MLMNCLSSCTTSRNAVEYVGYEGPVLRTCLQVFRQKGNLGSKHHCSLIKLGMHWALRLHGPRPPRPKPSPNSVRDLDCTCWRNAPAASNGVSISLNDLVAIRFPDTDVQDLIKYDIFSAWCPSPCQPSQPTFIPSRSVDATVRLHLLPRKYRLCFVLILMSDCPPPCAGYSLTTLATLSFDTTRQPSCPFAFTHL